MQLASPSNHSLPRHLSTYADFVSLPSMLSTKFSTIQTRPITKLARFQQFLSGLHCPEIDRGILSSDSLRNREFFELMPFISSLASQLDKLVPHSIPMLRKGSALSISFFQKQVSCLLANALLCTYPCQSGVVRGVSYGTINLNSFFSRTPCSTLESKLNCLIRYFKAVRDGIPDGIVTFSRVTLSSPPPLATSSLDLSTIQVDLLSSAPNSGGKLTLLRTTDVYCRDVFDSKEVEHPFFLYPELLVSILFTENLSCTEALLVAGCQLYSTSSDPVKLTCGHSVPDISDATPRDDLGRRLTRFAIITGVSKRREFHEQLRPSVVEHSFRQSFLALRYDPPKDDDDDPPKAPPVPFYSQHWTLKTNQQSKHIQFAVLLMACNFISRHLYYFAEPKFRAELSDFLEYVRYHHVTIGEFRYAKPCRLLVTGVYF